MKRQLFVGLIGVGAVIFLVVGFAVIRTLAVKPNGRPTIAIGDGVDRPADGAQTSDWATASIMGDRDDFDRTIASHLAQAIRFPTISWGLDQNPDAEAFNGFNAFLEETYPNAHRVLQRETVNQFSLMYRWPGPPGGGHKPFALLAHHDVVPVEPGTEDAWTHPPFNGVVADGNVWGRGALDNKNQVIAIMEAAEKLAQSGFQPDRDVYFLFGHDEELGGDNGAAAIAQRLSDDGVALSFTLDEGSGLVTGIIPGVTAPVALISTAEKGSTTLRFTATAQGGHSSTPAQETAVSLVSKAVVAVTDNPYPLEIDQNVTAFLHAIAPGMAFPQRFALTNLWLTGGFVKKSLAADRVTAASMRTTTAPTIIRGGVKTNILPQTAEAFVNYRIHPRDTTASVLARAIDLVNDDRITVEAVGAREPSPQSSTNSPAYAAIAETTMMFFPEAAIAPFLTLQGTDTKNYIGLADDHYRYAPIIYTTADLGYIHGTDERISIENLSRSAHWIAAFLSRFAAAATAKKAQKNAAQR